MRVVPDAARGTGPSATAVPSTHLRFRLVLRDGSATVLGNAYMKAENFHAAEEAYRQALQLFEKVSDLKAIANVRVSLGGVYASNQAPYDALLQWRQALELYRQLQIDDKVEFVEKLLRTSGRM